VIRRLATALLLAWLLPTLGVAAGDAPLAKLAQGELRGTGEAGVLVFRGVPYGSDTATTRFRAPRPAAAWQGVREARQFGPRCPQPVGMADQDNQGEDCLNLNIWTPALGDDGRRPVLVYLHGGGYNHGGVDEALYDGARLSRRGDLVVVTLHHRLNGFGYLYLGNLDPLYADSGNAGMLDLLLALRWVRDNIAAFGGDPGRVTLFGQSGGGAKIATLMAMPAAQGLFHGAWTMSGQQITGRRIDNARLTASQVLDALALAPDSLQRIESLDIGQLRQAMQGGTWTPVVDGRSLPADPFSPEAPAQSRALPMVLGNTLDETTSLIGPVDPSTFELDWERLPGKIEHHVSPFIGGLAAEDIVQHYRNWYPQASPSEVFFSATTAARSWKGMVIASDRRALQGGPTWVYYVHWRSQTDGGRWGAPHTVDIPLVFGTVEASPYTAGDPIAAELAEIMGAALIAFARHGDPNTPALPDWPTYRLDQRPAMVLDAQPRVESDPRGPERRLFAPIPYLQPGT